MPRNRRWHTLLLSVHRCNFALQRYDFFSNAGFRILFCPAKSEPILSAPTLGSLVTGLLIPSYPLFVPFFGEK